MTALWKKPGGPARHADPDAAIAAYLEELRQAQASGAPTPAQALNGLGDAHLDKGDLVSAMDYYRQAAEVYEREGMHDNAIACCKKIRRHAPDDLEVGLLLGRYYAAKGLVADAVAELGSYADRQSRSGRRREALEALGEIARLEPHRAMRREQLAHLLAEDGQREEALGHYRAALETYTAEGEAAGAERSRSALASLGAEPATAPRRGGELEIEATAYDEEPLPPAASDAAPAADELRAAGRWREAIAAYRRLADLGAATADDFASWAECARQAGEASSVLEVLAVSARWHLERGDVPVARRAAEEMLLVDPDNAVATEILEQVGTSLPRG